MQCTSPCIITTSTSSQCLCSLHIVRNEDILETYDGDVTPVRQNQFKWFSSCQRRFHVYKIVPRIWVNQMTTHLPNSCLDTENIANTVSRSLVVWSLLQTIWQFVSCSVGGATLSKVCSLKQESIHRNVI